MHGTAGSCAEYRSLGDGLGSAVADGIDVAANFEKVLRYWGSWAILLDISCAA